MKPYERGLILLVEDNDLVRWAVEEGLKESGWSVLAVTTGDAAILELDLDASRFAALLTDILLPGEFNGWEVAYRCRQLRPGLPIIYMTGDPLHKWSCFGVVDSILLEKPFTDQQLSAAFASCTGGPALK